MRCDQAESGDSHHPGFDGGFQRVALCNGCPIGKSLAEPDLVGEARAVIDAMKAQLAGGKLLMTAEESQAVRQTFMTKLQAAQQAKTAEQATKNKAEGDKFLAANKVKPGVKATASGLQYSVVKEGTGKKPTAESTVKVHYTGTLLDGTKFDSSVDRGQPFEFVIGVGQVIKGWDQGVAGMKVGGRRRITIPPNLAYGKRGAGGVIGPDETLVFVVDLIGLR